MFYCYCLKLKENKPLLPVKDNRQGAIFYRKEIKQSTLGDKLRKLADFLQEEYENAVNAAT